MITFKQLSSSLNLFSFLLLAFRVVLLFGPCAWLFIFHQLLSRLVL